MSHCLRRCWFRYTDITVTLLCHSSRSAPKRTLSVTRGSARSRKWSQSAAWYHVASRLMFDTFEERVKKLEEDITKSENSSQALLARFYWSPNNRSPPRCSFDSSHLPWSYWTVWSTATVRRHRNAGRETKEVRRGYSLQVSEQHPGSYFIRWFESLLGSREATATIQELCCSHILLKSVSFSFVCRYTFSASSHRAQREQSRRQVRKYDILITISLWFRKRTDESFPVQYRLEFRNIPEIQKEIKT